MVALAKAGDQDTPSHAPEACEGGLLPGHPVENGAVEYRVIPE